MEYLEWFTALAERYGIWAAIVIYFLIRDAWRDYRQDKVIAGLQAEMRSVILPIVQKGTEVITENTIVMRETKDRLSDCKSAIDECRLIWATRKFAPVATGGD